MRSSCTVIDRMLVKAHLFIFNSSLAYVSVSDWIDTVNLLLKIGILKITVRVDRIRFRGGVLRTMGWKTKQVMKTQILCS